MLRFWIALALYTGAIVALVWLCTAWAHRRGC